MEAHSVERKLAAIFAADVAGYSALMGRDEVGVSHRFLLLLKFRGRAPRNPARLLKVADRPAAQYGSSPDSPLEQAGFEPLVPAWTAVACPPIS